MKSLEYLIHVPYKEVNKAHSMMQSVVASIAQKYTNGDAAECEKLLIWHNNASWQVPAIMWAAHQQGCISDVKGKTILDLGCGAIHSPDQSRLSPRQFEPWTCRALHELGAHVIGIDIEDLSKEEFEHYSFNIMQPHALDFLADHSVDVANCAFLTHSPSLRNMGYTGEQLLQHVTPQLERIVKPDGYFLYDTH